MGTTPSSPGPRWRHLAAGRRPPTLAVAVAVAVVIIGASLTVTSTETGPVSEPEVAGATTLAWPPPQRGPNSIEEQIHWPVTQEPTIDPFASITSMDIGEHCAEGLDAAEITDFFARPIGGFEGADYQRALRLADDRVLWTFQDAFVAGTLVHNVGMIQSGRCFTMLNTNSRSWLLADSTSHMRQWHWILDGSVSSDGREIHLFVVQMNERGGSYLSQTRPTTLRRVVLNAATLEVVDVIDDGATGKDLYGWSVTSDDTYTYLYSHCYRQFGFDTLLGFGECAADVKLARVPRGVFDAERKYWDGVGWTLDHRRAVPVVDESFAGSGNNPAQIRFDGARYILVEKEGDWWGKSVEFGIAERPQGPFTRSSALADPLKCPTRCNTYFAAWLPWKDSEGGHIWSIGHNRWDGSETSTHLDVYRPTFSSVFI